VTARLLAQGNNITHGPLPPDGIRQPSFQAFRWQRMAHVKTLRLDAAKSRELLQGIVVFNTFCCHCAAKTIGQIYNGPDDRTIIECFLLLSMFVTNDLSILISWTGNWLSKAMDE